MPDPLARDGEIEVSGQYDPVSDNASSGSSRSGRAAASVCQPLQESQRRQYSLEPFQFANIEPIGRRSHSRTSFR